MPYLITRTSRPRAQINRACVLSTIRARGRTRACASGQPNTGEAPVLAAALIDEEGGKMGPPGSPREREPPVAYVLMLVIMYATCSSTLSVVNKWALLALPFPGVVTACQFQATAVTTFERGDRVAQCPATNQTATHCCWRHAVHICAML